MEDTAKYPAQAGLPNLTESASVEGQGSRSQFRDQVRNPLLSRGPFRLSYLLGVTLGTLVILVLTVVTLQRQVVADFGADRENVTRPLAGRRIVGKRAPDTADELLPTGELYPKQPNTPYASSFRDCNMTVTNEVGQKTTKNFIVVTFVPATHCSRHPAKQATIRAKFVVGFFGSYDRGSIWLIVGSVGEPYNFEIKPENMSTVADDCFKPNHSRNCPKPPLIPINRPVGQTHVRLTYEVMWNGSGFAAVHTGITFDALVNGGWKVLWNRSCRTHLEKSGGNVTIKIQYALIEPDFQIYSGSTYCKCLRKY